MSNNKILIIMGNGPSLKEVDFEEIKKYHTFGMNGAYKKYDELGFYPTYFGSFDFMCLESQCDNFSKLILNSPIQKFFFAKTDEFSPEAKSHDKLENLKFIHPFRNGYSTMDYFIDQGTSGANSTQVGILLGYTKIILIGCDANYIDNIPGSQNFNNHRIIVDKLENNPNYFWNDYQQKGEEYNTPCSPFHIWAWDNIARVANERGVDVVNCSPISKINVFRKSTLKEELPDYHPSHSQE